MLKIFLLSVLASQLYCQAAATCDCNRCPQSPQPGCECPCKNGGLCKASSDGILCDCPPGYSGVLCEKRYLNEAKLINLEKKMTALASKQSATELELKQLRKKVDDMKALRGQWRLHRANEILNNLEKIELHQTTPLYNQKIPIVLPDNTRAVIISVYCNFWNVNGHAYLNYEAHQKGNAASEGKVFGYNTHYNVYANTFYYEQTVPWDKTLSNELVFKVTSSYKSGGDKNWYRVRLVGYITAN